MAKSDSFSTKSLEMPFSSKRFINKSYRHCKRREKKLMEVKTLEPNTSVKEQRHIKIYTYAIQNFSCYSIVFIFPFSFKEGNFVNAKNII